jgi:hypothetical protein
MCSLLDMKASRIYAPESNKIISILIAVKNLTKLVQKKETHTKSSIFLFRKY